MSDIEFHEITVEDPRYALERDLRNRVLLRPLGIPDGGWEMRDNAARHFIAERGTAQAAELVACVLFWPTPEDTTRVQLMQMAVETAVQGQGIGRALVEYACKQIQLQGATRVFCHARAEVAQFYGELGFEQQGERFVEVGIEHVPMQRSLDQPSL